jgi:hypothetical protein
MSAAAADTDPRSARLGAERWLFWAGMSAFFGALAARKLGDFDLPWHIALGRAVAELRGIPQVDPLAFTHQRITFLEPLSELPLYWLWRSGGALPLQFFGALFSTGVGCTMVRSVPLGVLLVTPVLASRWAALLPLTTPTRWALATSSWLAAGVALWNPGMNLGVGFDATHFPERAVAFIQRHSLRGHAFNFSPFGGYLSLLLYPEQLVFMDGRLEHARDGNLVVRADDALRDPKVFAELEREFDFQYAVLSDPSAVLKLAITESRTAPLLLHDGQLAVAQDPYSARAAFLLACGELAMRNQTGFAFALKRLATLAPGHPALGVLATRFRQLQASAAPAP